MATGQNRPERLLTYAMYQDELVHISGVANGQACNCICPACRRPLIAKNNANNIKAPHFAHNIGISCSTAYETALHLLAKKVFQSIKILRTPDYHYDYKNQNEDSLFRKGEKVSFDTVELEQRRTTNSGSIVVDAIGYINKKELLVEFAVSHFADDVKRQKLKLLNQPCIEVDLSEHSLDEDLLKKFFLSKSACIYWLLNPRLDKDYQHLLAQKRRNLAELREKLRREEEERRRSIEDNVKESESRLHLLKADKGKKLFSSKSDQFYHCPILQERRQRLIDGSYYQQHEIIRRILNGERWNGVFYGRFDSGRSIFLSGKRIQILGPFHEHDKENEFQRSVGKALYAGLHRISEQLIDTDAGVCSNCAHCSEMLFVDGINYSVCNYHNSRPVQNSGNK